MAKKKNKLPKTLYAVRLDDGGDECIMTVRELHEISEDFHGDIVGVYELRATGKLNVEKKLKVGRG